MIEVTDDLGNPFRLKGPAERVVCLVPSITETLFTLGAGKRLVGITSFCIHPADKVRDKPKVGGTKNVDFGTILALEPGLVIANAEENRKHQIERLRAAGIPVFVTFPKTIDGCVKMIRDVAVLTGTEASAVTLLEDIEKARLEVRSAAPKPPPAVFCPIWKNPYMTINFDTFVGGIIREAGGRNVFEDAPGRYPTITLDEVAGRRPEIIILPTEPYRFDKADAAELASLGDRVPAVAGHRIHIVEGELLSWYGPRVARALRELSSLFRAG
jgi:ABC-type Fe3+-hydroxamate transport system substrate-binding protein